MPLGEADTRAKLIDPAIHAHGWTEDLIRREVTAGAVEVVEGQPRRRAKGRVDYTLRVRVNTSSQPVAVALIEAKAEHLPPAHGLEQGKGYAACRRLNVQFVFSSNGYLFVEFDRATGLTSQPRPLSQLMGRLPDAGRAPLLVRTLEDMMDYDLSDVLAELGYGRAPRTRPQRAEAFTYKHERWLAALPSPATATLKALAGQFARSGTDGLENPQVFETPDVTHAGGLPALRALGQPAEILRQTKERLFAA
jgi:hypothetical protein